MSKKIVGYFVNVVMPTITHRIGEKWHTNGLIRKFKLINEHSVRITNLRQLFILDADQKFSHVLFI